MKKKKKILIVESPTKARTIEKYLKGEIKVLSSKGHIKDLPEKKFGVDIEKDFTPQFVVIKGKSKIIKELKKHAKDADEVYIGCDPDREGEAIAYHIAEEIKRRDAKRVLFYEITEEKIKEALENPTQIDLKRVESQFSRRILDRLVGYKISPILWKLIKRGLSAGRVQTVALRLVVEREKEILGFEPKKYYELELIFEKNGEVFKGIIKKFKKEKIERIYDLKKAEEIKDKILSSQIFVTDIKINKKKIKPSPPFKTSTLQEEASKKLGFSPGKTMRIAQSLFEGKETPLGSIGLITYHRTDSVRISEKVIPEIREKIEEIYGKEYVFEKERKVKEKGKVQGAHEAIRPTKIGLYPDELKEYLEKDELLLYNLIYFRTLAFFSKDAEIEEKIISFKNDEFEGEIKGKKLLFDGFFRILGRSIEEIYVPELQPGERLNLKDIKIIEKETTPPSRYTEAELIKTLEKLGIGRPSTYAPTIEILYRRNYVERRGKTLFPTELGIKVSDILVEEFPDIFNVNFTKEMEDSLDEIEEGNLNRVEFLKKFWEKFKPDLIKANNRLKKIKNEYLVEFIEEDCPECGSKLVVKWGRFGKFISCSNFPECKYKRDYYENKFQCPECKKGFLVRRKKGKKIFFGCSLYPNCNFTTSYEPVERRCENCNFEYLFKIIKKRKTFYKCPSCGKFYNS